MRLLVVGCLVVCLWAVPPSASAQGRHTVRGQITDATTGRGIASAWLELPDPGQTIVANHDGWFAVQLAAGRYQVLVRALGYKSSDAAWLVSGDTTVVVTLQVDAIALQTLEVQVDRLARRTRAVPWPVRTLDRESIVNSRQPSLPSTC